VYGLCTADHQVIYISCTSLRMYGGELRIIIFVTVIIIIISDQTLLQCVMMNIFCIINYKGTAVALWLRCCAANRKVAGSIPDRTMAMGSTQPLT